MPHNVGKPSVPDEHKPVSDCSQQELAGIVRGGDFERLDQLPVPWTEGERLLGAMWAAGICASFPAPTLHASIYGLLVILRTSLVAAEWSEDILTALGSLLLAPPTARQLEAARRLRTIEGDQRLEETLGRLDINDLPKA